jgi:glutathione synthase
MRIVYVMDPLERMHPLKDSTFAFLRASAALGHTSYHCLPQQVTVRDGRVYAHVREASVSAEAPYHAYGAASVLPLDEVDAVLIRKDPPFDTAYLMLTLCLEYLRGKTLVVNDPQGLREANEKLYALHFSQWMVPTMVSSNRDEILAFAADIGGRAVIKPLDGAGGVGVMTLLAGDRNARAIVDVVTGEGARLAMVQGFIDRVTEGDKRVILLDGEPLGAILRVPRGDDFRANIHVGGSVLPTELTERERAIVADLAPRLRRDGLYFVGLDLVGEFLTEVNVTSPTGIQELGRFHNTRPEETVIRWVEEHRVRPLVAPPRARVSWLRGPWLNLPPPALAAGSLIAPRSSSTARSAVLPSSAAPGPRTAAPPIAASSLDPRDAVAPWGAAATIPTAEPAREETPATAPGVPRYIR